MLPRLCARFINNHIAADVRFQGHDPGDEEKFPVEPSLAIAGN